MGVKFLHDFIEANSPGEEIDLIKIAANHVANLPDDQRKPGVTPKFCLVIDGESCLNRLYGGYFSGKLNIERPFPRITVVVSSSVTWKWKHQLCIGFQKRPVAYQSLMVR